MTKTSDLRGEKTYTWRVEAVVPIAETGRTWNNNINIQVIAPTMQEAIDAMKERYPEVTFIKVMRDRWIEDVIVVG